MSDYDFYNWCEVCGQPINDKKVEETGDGEYICRKCRDSFYHNTETRKKTPIKKKNRRKFED